MTLTITQYNSFHTIDLVGDHGMPVKVRLIPDLNVRRWSESFLDQPGERRTIRLRTELDTIYGSGDLCT